MAQPDHGWVEKIIIKVGGSPIPHDVMRKVLEVTVESSLYLPDMVIIHLVDTDNFDITDGSLFNIGKDIEVFLQQHEESDRTVSVFKGEITAIEPSFGDNLHAVLTIRGYDRSHRMNWGTKTQVFVNVTDGDIVKKIAQPYGLSMQVEDPGQVYKHVYQHNLTDMQFLHERAQRNGYEVFVDNNTLYFRKPRSGPGQVELEWGDTLRSFRPRLSLAQQVSKVVVKGWNPDDKQPVTGLATSSDSAPKVPATDTGGRAGQQAFGANAQELVVRRPVYNQSEAQTLAKALLDEINAGLIEADGVAIGNPKLKSGTKVKVTKVSQKFEGEYIVTAARHAYTPEGYETHFTVQGTRPRLMSDLIENQSIFSDQHQFWGGVVPALVKNINDKENKGRVEVSYPWMDDTLKSGWARVATLGAGKGRGFLWMPEVNDEVLVAFENGDFNRPYIVGSLWNGKDEPPESWTDAVQGNKSQRRTLKSREGHIIRMVDGPSDKYIEIIDSAQGTTIKLDANARTLSIDSKDAITIKTSTNLKIDTTGNIDIKSQGNTNITATGNLKVSGTGTVEVSAGATLDVKANGPVTLKGAIVNIN